MNRIQIGSYSIKKGLQQDSSLNNHEGRRNYDSKRNSHKVRKFFITFFVLIVLTFCGFIFINFGDTITGTENPLIQSAKSLCTTILDPKCWTDSFKPKLKQTEEGYTNLLLVGLDTRSNDKGLLNTDSVILLSYDNNKKETTLISIPRDFYSFKYATRINAVYAFTKEKDKSDPFRYLKEEVTSITGLDINYFATIHFGTFEEIIDNFGGIEICTEDAFRAQYPNENTKTGAQWVYYDFPKGCQTLSGEKALVYSRFRYVAKGPSSLASDFSRARRQQEVITAVKDKALSQNMSISERASTYWGLLQSLQKNIDTNIGFEDILGGLAQMGDASKDPINIVLDPTFGGLNSLIITDASSGAYYIKAKDSTYTQIKKELLKIRDNSGTYKEQANILVKNQSSSQLNSNHPVKRLEKNLVFKKSFIYRNELGKADFVGVKLIDFTNGKMSNTRKQIMEELQITQIADPLELGITQTTAKEDFVIIIGNDVTPSSASSIN